MPADRRKTTRKRKKGRARRIIILSFLILLALLIILGFVIARAVTKTNAKQDTAQSTVNTYDTTPAELQSKVAYYAFGLLGADVQHGSLEYLSVVCYDKKAKTLSVLEVPRDTYLGKSDLFAVKKAGDVWAHPAPLDWCEFEGKRLFKAEIEEHKAAGHTVTTRAGSSAISVISIFNEQYGLPIDEYFMVPQEAVVKLVDLLGGVDVELESAMTLGETKFGRGIKTLDGASALAYLLRGDDGVKGNLERTVRQRKVWIGILQRLCAQTEKELQEDTLRPVMTGSTPIRSQMATDDCIALVRELSKVKLEKMTVQLLPGAISNFDSDSFYRVNRDELVAVINELCNPYRTPLTEADVTVEPADGNSVDVHRQTMAEIAVAQSGVSETTAAETQTTKAAS